MKSREEKTTSGAARNSDDPKRDTSSRGRGKRRSGFAISRDGAAIFFEVLGQPHPAPTLVLCDGLGCDGYVWKYLQWALADKWRIVHLHYRGHGQTPLPKGFGQVSIADFATDVLAVMDASETERAVICGHSLGVQVCLEVYRQGRERTDGLVLICGSYRNPLSTFKGKETLGDVLPILQAAVSRVPRLVGAFWKRLLPLDLSYQIARRFELNGELVHREDFAPYLDALSRMDPRMFVATMAAAGQHDAQDVLPQISVPTLLVTARHDTFTPMKLSEEMREKIPGSELHVVEAGTHTAPIERPSEVSQVVRSFLERRILGQ
ncbi:MAG TPA: alpha/beta hydrolase [Pseudomonadota bacterium]|nr:alpha/beta hydrolase [Pseudomonadota bacterium]